MEDQVDVTLRAKTATEIGDLRQENERLRRQLRNSFKGYLRDELKEGVAVQYVGVHAVAWAKRPENPTVGFIRWGDVEGFDETNR